MIWRETEAGRVSCFALPQGNKSTIFLLPVEKGQSSGSQRKVLPPPGCSLLGWAAGPSWGGRQACRKPLLSLELQEVT
jgi:hypothetical protein